MRGKEKTKPLNVEDKLKHLNLVLRAVRNVNQLITRERNRDKLIQSVCNILIANRGYYNVWIALLDESRNFKKSFEAGLGKDFLPMVELLKRGTLTDCAQKAIKKSDTIIIKDPLTECVDCPLSKKYSNRSGLTVRLENSGKLYGVLSASIPTTFIDNKEDLSLFEEVAGDIAYAMYSIEQEEKRKQAEEVLKKRMNESNCLYDVSSLMAKPDASLEEVFNGLVSIFPPCWQYPKITCSRIIFKEQEFKTDNFKETEWKQTADIIISGNSVGTLEVYYLEEKPERYEGPFIKEERRLIDNITEEIAKFVERKQREEIIMEQSQAILELSTPVMQVLEGVVIAPLIGTLDSQRTQRFMEVLLARIVNTNSQVALVDITGVPTIDTQTAQHLIETISAVRLLGAKVVLTGVRPAIAQTLIHLGIELADIDTRSSMAAGLRLAFDFLDLKLISKS